jgi:hypothetical protein
MDKVVETHCGNQSITFEAPDLLVVKLRGEVTRQEIRDLHAARDALTAGLEHVLLLCCLRDLERISMAAGRGLADKPDPRVRAIALVNASYRTQILAQMAIRSAQLFTNIHTVLHFAETEESARAWLANVRENKRRRM